MMKTVAAVTIDMYSPRWVCAPSARNASSGPYADEDSPSAPRPTQAKKAASAMCWRVDALRGSSGLPITRSRNFSYVVMGCWPRSPRPASMALGRAERWESRSAAADAAPQLIAFYLGSLATGNAAAQHQKHSTPADPGLQGGERKPASPSSPACRLFA